MGNDKVKRVECIHCKARLVISGGTTTHFKRHLDGCTRRKLNLKSQKMLNLIPSPVNNQVGIVSNFQYDHVKMRELIAHFIIMHEHPFTIVGQDGFNLMMKTATLHFQKIIRATAKNDCMVVYEMMKIKLKAMLKNVNKISLTTDLWRSNQQIEYMVVTGHFVDIDWKLQKRVLSFVNVSPPRGEGGTSFTSCVTELSEDFGWSKFHQFVRTTENIPPSKSELDAYLEESIQQCKQEESKNFDSITRWGLNNLKFRTLSRMACDILAIPASTVASESTFSVGGRIIDSYQFSLVIETVQTLVCGADWVRNLHGVKGKTSKNEEDMLKRLCCLFDENYIVYLMESCSLWRNAKFHYLFRDCIS